KGDITGQSYHRNIRLEQRVRSGVVDEDAVRDDDEPAAVRAHRGRYRRCRDGAAYDASVGKILIVNCHTRRARIGEDIVLSTVGFGNGEKSPRRSTRDRNLRSQRGR